MILNVIPDDDKILYQTTEVFNFDQTDINPTELFHSLRETMCKNRGIGLSAPQCGLSTSVFVMGNPDDPSSVVSVFNPKIIDIIGEEEYYDEGCLTFPGLFVRIKRPSAIRVRYTTHENVTDTIKFDGMTARVFLHEYDHLQGILYTERAKSYHLDKARRKQKIYLRQRARNVELSAVS